MSELPTFDDLLRLAGRKSFPTMSSVADANQRAAFLANGLADGTLTIVRTEELAERLAGVLHRLDIVDDWETALVCAQKVANRGARLTEAS